MKILILTPMFPPVTAASAAYCKELATRLKHHETTVLMYGKLPEKIKNVNFECVNNRQPIIVRFYKILAKLLDLLKKHGVLIVLNGPSTELPAFFASAITNKPIIFIEYDKAVGVEKFWHKIVRRHIKKKADKFLSLEKTTWPKTKPMIHPLKDTPGQEIAAYQKSWDLHMELFSDIIK